MKLFLLDGYALIYRAYYGLIKNPRINSRGEDVSAVFGFARTLQEVMSKEHPTHLGVAFDPHGGTFRHVRYPDYKAQRQATPEGIRIAVPVIKQLLEAQGIPVLEVAGYEADDVIGTLSRQADAAGIDTYMVTPDKDYGQLVTERVRIYRPKSRGGGFDVEGPAEVCARWGLQQPSQVVDLLGLMGDKSDNIPGCPGVGETRAVELIARYGSIEGLIAHVDELKGAMQTRVAANVEQIRLSRWLAEIVTTVPISLDLDALTVRPLTAAQASALRDIYLHYEMRSLAAALEPAAAAAPAAAEPDLFTQAAMEVPATQQPDLFDSAPAVPATVRVTLTSGALPDIAAGTTVGFALEEHDGQLTAAVALSPTCAAVLTTSGDAAPHEAVAAAVGALLGRADVTLAVHDWKPVVKLLRRRGVAVAARVADTMIAHYLLHPEMSHSLVRLQQAYTGECVAADGTPLPPAASAACTALALSRLLLPQLEAEGVGSLYAEVEMPLVGVLADMETAGIRLDSDALAEASRTMAARMEALETEIHMLAGTDFNISSPRQVGDVLFERLQLAAKAKRTKTGVYATSEEVLLPLRQKHPIVQKILDYRAAQKLRSTYLDALPRLADPSTGRIHTQLNQAITATGRLSSSNPNLQNIPVRTDEGRDIRGAFVADEGQLFFAADYSQIELRLMAHLSGDAGLIEDFRQGHDIHAATAAKIFHKPIADVTRQERSRAKTANFGIIYGITAFGLAERLDISRGDAKELIEGYFATYPQVHAYMQESIERARSQGYAETLMHRRCRVDGIASANATVRSLAERIAINAPIQGSAADIIKLAMVRIARRMAGEQMRSRMLLQVHDELIFTVVPDERERMEHLVVAEMEQAAQLQVPLVASTGWGHSWKDAH